MAETTGTAPKTRSEEIIQVAQALRGSGSGLTPAYQQGQGGGSGVFTGGSLFSAGESGLREIEFVVSTV